MLDRKGEVAIHYHKQFLATHDQNWFAFGERGCPVVDTDLGRIGLLICFDGRIPEIARAHHEKVNGSGYPLGMPAQDIPVLSKIMAIADITSR